MHGIYDEDMKYCHACLVLNDVKRWLCPGCRDNRAMSGPYSAMCYPGYCPAVEVSNNRTWHTAERNRPPWFTRWADENDFNETWTISKRTVVLERWCEGFMDGDVTERLSDAQKEAKTGLNVMRNQPTTLPDDNSFFSLMRAEEPARR